MSVFDLDDAPNWRGRDVIDRNGHAVGVITDLYVDEASGRPEWAGVRTGMLSHRVTFVPLAEATAHGLRIQDPFDQRQIHGAPSFDPGGHLTAEDEAGLFRHYGLDHGPVDGSGRTASSSPRPPIGSRRSLPQVTAAGAACAGTSPSSPGPYSGE